MTALISKLKNCEVIKLNLRIEEQMQICIPRKDDQGFTKASEPSFDLEGGAKGQI